MPLILRPQRWRRQPSHPLALRNDLLFADGIDTAVVAGGSAGWEVHRGQALPTAVPTLTAPVTATGNITYGANQFGRTINGAQGGYVTLPTTFHRLGRQDGGTANTHAFSLLFVGQIATTSGWSYLTDAQGHAGGITVYKSNAGYLNFLQSSNCFNDTDAVPIPTTPFVMVVTSGKDGGTMPVAWINGVKYISASSSQDSWISVDELYICGSAAFPNDNYFGNGSLNLLAFFCGLLNDGEAKALSDNPWQIFADSTRRIFLPLAAGGGGGGGIIYPQLERGVRGLERGVYQ